MFFDSFDRFSFAARSGRCYWKLGGGADVYRASPSLRLRRRLFFILSSSSLPPAGRRLFPPCQLSALARRHRSEVEGERETGPGSGRARRQRERVVSKGTRRWIRPVIRARWDGGAWTRRRRLKNKIAEESGSSRRDSAAGWTARLFSLA